MGISVLQLMAPQEKGQYRRIEGHSVANVDKIGMASPLESQNRNANMITPFTQLCKSRSTASC